MENKLQKTETKYYIPQPEEIHIGFEYEWDKKGSGDFEKLTLTENWSLSRFVEEIYNERVRVKLLDRADLEELGWRVIKEPYRWQWEYVDNVRWKLTTDIYTSTEDLPPPHPNSGSISIKDNKDGDNYCVFYGYIRNKSELRKIMEHLDIIQFKPLNLL